MANNYRLNPYDGDILPGEDLKLFRDATKEVDKKERFSLVNSGPVLITIAISEALLIVFGSKHARLRLFTTTLALDHRTLI